MKFLLLLSDFLIPVLIISIICIGIKNKRPVYDDFVEGARHGMKTVIEILPTLVGLMMGIGILRSSGFLDMLSELAANAPSNKLFPAQIIPVAIVRMFSASAATGLCLDVFKEYGPDSYLGLVTSIMMSCTETIFYTMSVYALAAGIKKTRWTLPGALFCTLCGIVASVLIAKLI